MDKNLILLLTFTDIAVKKISLLMDLIFKMEIKNFIKQDYCLKFLTQSHLISNTVRAHLNFKNIS